jgi:hypothetical protein
MRTIAAIASLAVALAAACPAPSSPQNSKRVPDAPLDFDPARPEAVDGWWSNGAELLRLEPSGAYRLWITQDRFMRPIEVGAWRRDNYVFFDLEPYGAKPGTRHRIDMRKRDGRTELVRDGMAAFRALATPPRVFGDEMLGAWVSPVEELLVLETGRYEWRRVGASTGISAHSGQWMTDGDTLTIVPDTDTVASVTLRGTRRADGLLVLEGPNGGTMVRPAPAPAPQGATPAPGPAGASGSPAGANPKADG